MSECSVYSTLFSTLYDEPDPVGHLGRGAHYSVLRSVEWLDVVREPLSKPQVHDFAVIWDEDHDIRVIEAIEKMYMEGLLSPVQFIGERKGTLTVLVASCFYFQCSEKSLKEYESKLQEIAQPADEDYWPVEVGSFDRAPLSDHQCDPHAIIMAHEYRVLTYLKNIDSLWSLGTKDFQPKRDSVAPFPPLPS